MIIQLKHDDIVRGIELRLKELGINTDEALLEVSLTTSRKPRHGITANVEITNLTPTTNQ